MNFPKMKKIKIFIIFVFSEIRISIQKKKIGLILITIIEF